MNDNRIPSPDYDAILSKANALAEKGDITGSVSLFLPLIMGALGQVPREGASKALAALTAEEWEDITVPRPTAVVDDFMARALGGRARPEAGSPLDVILPALGTRLTPGGKRMVQTLCADFSDPPDLERIGEWLSSACNASVWNVDLRLAYANWRLASGEHEEAVYEYYGVMFVINHLIHLFSQNIDAAPWRIIPLYCARYVVVRNQTRALIGSERYDEALTLIKPELNDQFEWQQSQEIFDSLCEHLKLDRLEMAREGLTSGDISPCMVAWLLQDILARKPVDLRAMNAVMIKAEAHYAVWEDFDWRNSDAQLVATLRQAKTYASGALLAGWGAKDDVWMLLGLDPPESDRAAKK